MSISELLQVTRDQALATLAKLDADVQKAAATVTRSRRQDAREVSTQIKACVEEVDRLLRHATTDEEFLAALRTMASVMQELRDEFLGKPNKTKS